MNNSFTNIILVVILVLLVGFGVWYVTGRSAPVDEGTTIQVDLGGSGGDGLGEGG